MIADIEQAIIERLKGRIKGAAIESYPDNPSEYRLRHAKGAVLVRYKGSDFSEPIPTDIVAQDRTVDFEVVVVMRHLTSSDGIYETLEAVLEALTGYQIKGCSRMYPRKEEFVSEDNGIWQYAVIFRTSTMYAQKTEDSAKIGFKDGQYQ